MSDLMRDEFEVLFAAETDKKAKPGQVEEFDSIGGFALVLVEAMKEDRIGDTYRQSEFAAAWWAWQASRECLVIELPYVHSCAPSEASSDQDYYLDEAKSDMRHQCRAAIHAAGVKYK